MIASVAGALVRPMPEPKSTIWAVICRYGVPADTDDAQASPAARETMPAATTILVPSRTASLVPSTEAVAEAARRQHERREHQVIGVDDPLQLARGRAQFADQARQRDINDRGVEIDHQRRKQQGPEDQSPARR
jgi:hypothetical protein